MTFKSIVACCEGPFYASNYFLKANKKLQGKHILINGISGGIGSAVAQIFKAHDYRVEGICGTKYKKELLDKIDIDRIYDYQKQEEVYQDKKYDFILDTVGNLNFSKMKHLLNSNGIYSSSKLGPYYENVYNALLPWRPVKFPIPTHAKKTLEITLNLISKGQYKPIIDREYPFEEIIEAYKYVEQGNKLGNVVIRF